MRRVLPVTLVIALGFASSAMACGDKFLIIGRASRYQGRYVAIHPATILLYGPKAAGDRDVDVARILKRAGHRVDYEPAVERFDAAVRAKAYDFVIVALDGVADAEKRTRAAESNALVVPIIYASSDDEVKQIAREYECIANSEKKQRSFLAVLDDAMAMRLSGAPIKCHWAAK